MSKVIKFPTIEPAVLIERTEKFKAAAEVMSDFIKALPLTPQDNDQLITLITKQLQIAEVDAFQQGFTLGLDVKGAL